MDGDSCLWVELSATTQFCQRRAAEAAFLQLRGSGWKPDRFWEPVAVGCVTLHSPRLLSHGSARVSSAQQVEGSVFLESGQDLEPEFKL